MDQLKAMQAFVLTVESGSFAAASARLSLSPQRVAHAVAQLEAQLTLALLQRTTRRQSLTEFGEVYYVRCRQILNQLEEANALAQQMKSQPEGQLRVSAPVTFGNTCLMGFICHFLDTFPAININLTLTDRLGLLDENDTDVAFRIGDSLDPGRIARPLKPYQLIACAAPAYLAKWGTPAKPADLTDHECLKFSWPTPPAQDGWLFSNNNQYFYQPVNGRLQVNNSHALLMAALAGQGIIMAAELLVHDSLSEGKLIQILAAFTPPGRQMHLLYPAELERRVKVQVFIDAAMRRFGISQAISLR